MQTLQEEIVDAIVADAIEQEESEVVLEVIEKEPKSILLDRNIQPDWKGALKLLPGLDCLICNTGMRIGEKTRCYNCPFDRYQSTHSKEKMIYVDSHTGTVLSSRFQEYGFKGGQKNLDTEERIHPASRFEFIYFCTHPDENWQYKKTPNVDPFGNINKRRFEDKLDIDRLSEKIDDPESDLSEFEEILGIDAVTLLKYIRKINPIKNTMLKFRALAWLIHHKNGLYWNDFFGNLLMVLNTEHPGYHKILRAASRIHFKANDKLLKVGDSHLPYHKRKTGMWVS